MYFKRLELFGFKSFAERTKLDFEPGITAIVGPNGCGKSNIADSIKWVLGEQSAKMLRGGKMEDVIFNGTDGREPVNYAEVSLTLSNQDRILPIEYDEVTVARRLYRSGESEYLINKTTVRLKDVSELFMGTGIGTSAYSLIEQGKIDQVLSSRPEDRREVFEEASGITKYKSKRKEAMRRLDGTEQNLVRINDIIIEVKRQINSIERQARKAERYKERYEELKALELKLTRIELELLNQKIKESSTNLEGLKTRESELNSGLQKMIGELSELNTQRSEIESKRMDFKSTIIETDSEVSKSKDKLSMNRERIEELKKRRIDLESEIEKSADSIKSQRKEVEGLREKVSTLQTEDMERSSALSVKEKRLDETSKTISENETTISTSKANLIDLASKESKLRNQSAKISTTLASDDARLKRLTVEKDTILEEKNSLDVKLSDVLKEVEQVETEVLSLKDEKESVSQKVSALTSRIESLTSQSTQIHQTLATNKSRFDVLNEAKAKYEGFSSGVKAIMGKGVFKKKPIEGVQDALANLFSVNKGYEIAIESALGENLESILVDDLESAEKAIEFLKENSLGKALFAHPDSFRAMQSETSLSDSRILGRAIDFARINNKCRNILEYLLKDTFIVKDLKDAASILKENPDLKESTFVTLLGEKIGRGFVSGGDIRDAGLTLINREENIKELFEIIAASEARFKIIEEEKLTGEQEKEELEKRSEVVTSSLNEKEIMLANARTRRSNIEENMKGVADEISLVSLEVDEVTSEAERLKEEELSVVKALKQSENDTHLNQERIKRSEILISDYAKEKEQLIIEVAEQRTELGSLESKKEGLSNTLNLLDSSLKDVENSRQARKAEIEDSIKKVKELSDGLMTLEKNIESLSEKSGEKGVELEGVESVYSAVMQKIKEQEVIFKQSEKEINSLRSNVHEIDLKRAETNYGLENLTQRIKDVYKLDLNEVEIVENWQDIERDALRSEVEEKREKLDSMGTVNLVAIEEHTELQDRFAFLTHQRDDLLKAKDTLLKAIAKINKITKELFMETFKSIQVEFRNFFKMLFGGGDGELILLDENNVLESGIEIVARPPGKRLQNVSLLSGGEKALTAISLIFAIFKVKPSPFCVLDEIDAPLDESNVDRFSRSLDMFTNTSQFIVITHNKKTIDKADVMYGITMQQSGVSKVVSVKFSDSRKQEAATK
ncbi:MAG: chromosome segregation protein SMC [Candidatus Gorgyraea atricola]|nr:chromosome segregation protein SMC [Candidatus Gorgyraea atricola]